MSLLEHYLTAVRMYLPGGSQAGDIIDELRENLASRMDEREAAAGRPLTEAEQEAVLNAHGNPMIVAGRYSPLRRSLTFGVQLIGPELFPIYVRVLAMVWGISILVHTALAIFMEPSIGIRTFLFSVSFQFAVITSIFIGVDFFHRRYQQRWYVPPPPAYLQPIPRWQSASSLVVWLLITFWWAAVPQSPTLLFGAVADHLALAPGWLAFYWPVLLLLVAGAAQRAINLVRPDWNWLLPATRLVINTAGLVMLYFILESHPYVVVSDPAVAPEWAPQLVRAVNGLLWWSLLSGFSFYLLISAGLNAWLGAQHLRFFMRSRGQAPQHA